ncbi:type II toxin-antitoxin system RelE/ParE family toxin [Pleurocapsa sp. PCC 7319]|uniref:type II toxin-antitoxin system RelE family toxin n=1 Tax=Pleurocapsa sp. PCC 7319 TaxID=118161 RepID=UPI0003496417|nr:type II toxin-antitoxin system RelE/ParE family toxin [Pleurocapsa sp. PCC 7319]
MYKVRLSLDAEKVFAKCNKALAKKLARCFSNLENSPRSHPNIKPLKGSYSGYYRYRVGDYRVVYSIEDELVVVNVILIAHRSKVYE